jgi:hypothetical protein
MEEKSLKMKQYLLIAVGFTILVVVILSLQEWKQIPVVVKPEIVKRSQFAEPAERAGVSLENRRVRLNSPPTDPSAQNGLFRGYPEKEYNHIEVEFILASPLKDDYRYQTIAQAIITNGCPIGYALDIYNQLRTLTHIRSGNRPNNDIAYAERKSFIIQKYTTGGDVGLPPMPDSMVPMLNALLEYNLPREDLISGGAFKPKKTKVDPQTPIWNTPQDVLKYIQEHPAVPPAEMTPARQQ